MEKTLRGIAPDVVFAMEYNPTILRAVHWCRRKKIPFISWTDGTLHSERGIGKVQRLSRSYIIKRAAAFIASSTASKEAQIAYGADPDKCFLSYLTVDIRKYLFDKYGTGEAVKTGKQLIYVGSLIQRKGLDLLLPALAKTEPDIRLVIVGEGQEKPELEAQIADLGLKERVRFCGYVEGEALQKLYRESDAFILPTREDCFGLVILEAMCASLPVISSKYADGARDLVTEGENGYIVDRRIRMRLPRSSGGFFRREGLPRWEKKATGRRRSFPLRTYRRDVSPRCGIVLENRGKRLKKRILFNGLGNRGWIGGLYYIKNIMFSCLQNPEITERFRLTLLIDPAHADIFACFQGNEDVDIRIYTGQNKMKLALCEMRLVWLGGVKYCYALELNKIGRLFKKRGIFWIPDFQHKTLPEFFSKEELARKEESDLAMVMSRNMMVLSSFDAAHDLKRFYPAHTCPVEVVHFVSYIEPEVRAVTPELEQKVREKFGLNRKYIYIPNQFWQHKNHIVMVRAIELLLGRGRMRDYDFVFTGNLNDYRNPEYIESLKKIMESPSVCDNIKLLGFVERTEQLAIMKNAQFMVQPSLCEGWGTVLEDAKVLDKVVLLSNIPYIRSSRTENAFCLTRMTPGIWRRRLHARPAGRASRACSGVCRGCGTGDCEHVSGGAEYSRSLARVFIA